MTSSPHTLDDLGDTSTEAIATERSRLSARALVTALTLGVMGDAVLRGGPPGVGFGPGGEGFVRFALIENDERTRRAAAAIGEFLARLGSGPTTAPGIPTPPTVPHVDKAAGLK